MRRIGTVSRGIRLPVVMQGDDIVKIVTESVLQAAQGDYAPFAVRDRDIVGVTESLLARAQGNYVSTADIAADVRAKFPSGDVAVLFPIMSRNRFYPLLRGIVAGVAANGAKVHVFFSYPDDEVGNELIGPQSYYEKMASLPEPSFGEELFYAHFGEHLHRFTGVDYIQLYKSIDPEHVVCHFTNDPHYVLQFTKNVLVASIHAREVHKTTLRAAGANVAGLDDICNRPMHEGMGYNPDYGLLGSNYTSDERIKLFPRDADKFVRQVQEVLKAATGKHVEVLVYGDGAFKDPVCGIWELADPVVSPGFTDGLSGTPNEIKFKYVADSTDAPDKAQAVREAIRSKGEARERDLTDKSSLGTTPRQLADLVGSLCDLTSGSGDKGTPVVYISGYFDSYVDE